MLARRFTIVCLLMTLFGMFFAILVAEASRTRPPLPDHGRPCPASSTEKLACRSVNQTEPPNTYRRKRSKNHDPPHHPDPEMPSAPAAGRADNAVHRSAGPCRSEHPRRRRHDDRGARAEEDRRRLRPDGQPAARVSVKSDLRPCFAAVSPPARRFRTSIMGHGKANLPGTHRISRFARAVSRGRALPTPREAVAALKALYNRNTAVPARFLRRACARRRSQQALPRLLSRDRRHDLVLQPDQLAPGLWPHADAGTFLDHDHQARPVRELPDRAVAADHAQSRRAGNRFGIRDADPGAFRLSRRHACRRRRWPTASSVPFATCSTCRTSTEPTTTSPTARSRPCRASRGRWRRSPRSASTIRCTGCRTTRRPARIISRISCCSPTTSSTSTNSASMRAI